MKRTTIFLPDELHEHLRIEAIRSRVTVAQLIRSRLENRAPARKKLGASKDPLLRVAGICRGQRLSGRIDEEMYGI